MTGTVSILAELLTDCEAKGIRLLPASGGGMTIDAPQDALTPDLLDRLKAHKAELVALLRPAPGGGPSINPPDAAAVWQAALDRLEGDPLFPPDEMEGLRAANVQLVTDRTPGDSDGDTASVPLGPDGWPLDSIDPDEVAPCPECGSLELWQSAAGDKSGLKEGRWRCVHCDPPTAALRLLERAERIRRRMNRSGAPKQATHSKFVCQCGSIHRRDVPIHDGQSIRRECARCRQFIDFPVWYGKDTVRSE